MKRLLLVTFGLVLSLAAFAQELPRKSPLAHVSQQIGLTDVTITYSRPAVNDRTIWGELVPYGEVWRTGANGATKITFQHTAFIEGQLVPAGDYALFTIPGKDKFTVLLNTDADQWGAYGHDPKLDLVSFEVPTEKAPKTERLTFHFENLGYDNAHLCMSWDEVKIRMNVETRATAQSMAVIQKMFAEAEAGDYSAHIRAVRFAVENNVMIDQAAEWANTAVEVSDGKYDAVWWRAVVFAAQEDYTNAVAMGEKALNQLSEAERARMGDYIEGEIANWRKKRDNG